jgi:hypothetical protein
LSHATAAPRQHGGAANTPGGRSFCEGHFQTEQSLEFENGFSPGSLVARSETCSLCAAAWVFVWRFRRQQRAFRRFVDAIFLCVQAFRMKTGALSFESKYGVAAFACVARAIAPVVGGLGVLAHKANKV